MAQVLTIRCEREAEAHDECAVRAGLVEQLELVDEELGLGLFVSGGHRPYPRPDELSYPRYLHSQQGQWLCVEGAEEFGVGGVLAGSEPELGDGDRFSGCLEPADPGQVLVGGEALLAVEVDADDVEVIPVDALERGRAVADRAAVDAAYRCCGLSEECAQCFLPDSTISRRPGERLRCAWLRPGTMPRINVVSSLPTQKVRLPGQRRNSGSDAAAASVT
jgi:hypothetical protein